MSTVDIVYDKIHSRHNPQWTTTIGPTDGDGVLLCVACVIEMMDDDDIGSERKSFALSHISGVLKLFPGALRTLLQKDDRVSQHFIASLLAMLQTAEDGATLEQVVQALVQLLLELQSEQCIHLVLDKIQTQLSVQPSVQRFIPTFNFLGRLVLAVPTLAQSLVVQYVPLLENLCWALLYPDEGLKASVFYIWMRVYEAAGGSVAQSLPVALRDRVCVLLLRTLANAGSPQLIINCLGLLKELVRLGPVVSVLMNTPSDQIMPDADQNPHTDNSQTLSLNQEQQSLDCPLPLILKKLLRSGEENVMVASAFCMAFILVHSPSQYSAPFIHADVPEFLFERLCCTPGEMLLYPIYNCLLLLTEDPLFFSQCHPVYGIGSVVRSLKEALKLTNLDVPKQGLQLLTEILERQPPGVRLFPSGPEFVAVSEAVIAGVSSSCLGVATQAAHAATVLLRMNHQSIPVQYKEIERLVEAITTRCSELSLPSSAHRPSTGSLKWATPNSQASKSGGFLLQALACFQAACRLAKQCASEPFLKENAFTAPSKQLQAQDSLESLCRCLLQCCDTVCIPTVTRVCESAPNAKALQYFYSILSSQFTLLPCLMPLFSRKLASSGFYRLALEHKALFCGGNRNPDLNMSCSGFLLKISMCLLSQSDPSTGSYQQDPEEVEYILQCGLPLLCCRVSDWPSLLGEAPGGLQLAEHNGARATQYCLIIMLQLALEQGDRLLPDEKVFSSAVWLLHSVQVLDCLPPRSVLRSALYLLAVTQDKSPDLDRAELNCIIKVLSSGQRFSSLYIHHPPLLHFIYRYTELAETFGPLVLELWLTQQACPPEPEQTTEQADRQEEGEKRESRTEDQEPNPETMELLTLMQKYPPIILTLLDMVSTRGAPLAQRALGALRVFLQGRRSCEADLCALLRPALLQVLQRLSGEYSQGPGQEHNAGVVDSLPLVLKLLCVMQANEPPYSDNEIHFKLLYHVSTLAGKMKPSDTESSLLPALRYVYRWLSVTSAHCADRAVSMLLSNSGLMDQLQTILSASYSPSPVPSLAPSIPPPSPPLQGYCHLLLSSLITLQRIHSAQVHKRIRWNLDRTMQRLCFQKRNTDSFSLVGSLKLLQALLDVDMKSELVSVSAGPGVTGPRPLEATDGALYPLGSEGARRLVIALHGLLLQKEELLLRVSVNCLASLLSFLQRKSPETALYVVCQPWVRLLFYILLNSGESCLLHPATLTLLTLFLRQPGSTTVLWEPDLLQVMEAVERRGLNELDRETAQALRLLFTQVQSGVLQPPPSEEHRQRVRAVLESLGPQPLDESLSYGSNILRDFGRLFV